MAHEGEKSAREARPVGPELRLIDRRAFVGFPELALAPGVALTDFALQIPDVTFPFSITGGASRYQRKKLDFGFLELSVDAEVISRKVAELAGKLPELDELKLHFRPGYLEGQARIRGGERAAVTFKVAFDGDGERLAVYLYDVRLYAFTSTSAPQVPPLLSRHVQELALLPEVELRGASGFTARILPPLVQLAAVGRGYKMPSLDQARLSSVEVSSKGLRLRFSSGGLPPPATPDEELLLALEGARAFADAEELVAQGKLRDAREAYLRLGDATEAHPFAVERLLALLVADPQAHELALDIAASLARRRDKSATAAWAEAVVRERRGESARAAERYLALCALSRKQQEHAAAFFAAESAARAARDQAPQMAVRALHELLGIRPDHLPSLQALARASDLANDRAGAIRAYRRIAALARDPSDAAEAHVQLARLCALTEDDAAGARLHCEAALRLSPDHPEALYQLAELCHRGGEHLRAIKALDRLRQVALARHEVDRVGRANLLAGLVWEEGLRQPENALLRYREAVSLLPGEPEPLHRAARVAESLGRIQEAVAGYQQAIELAGPAPRSDEVRKAAHLSHHALARLCRQKLGDPAKSREHLEAALALDPSDVLAIEELLPYFRATGKAAELADALEKAAAIAQEPTRRASYWAEAGELYRGRLANPDKAEKLLASALESDSRNRLALEGMLALAEGRRDGGQLCRCLKSLAELAEDQKERVRHFRRLAVAARDLSFDLDLAAFAFQEVLKSEPEDLPALGELCGLHRRRADMNGLAAALEKRARAAEVHGDKRLASAALRELAQVLEARLGRAAEALVALEKAARLSPEPQALLDLANLSLRCERPEHARRALEDLLVSLPKHAAPERVAEVRALLGRACELLGDREAALENYAFAFPLRRLDDELAGRLEALYESLGKSRELTDLWAARAQALLAASRPADAAPLFFKSARALRQHGDHAGAALRLNAALDAAPDGESAGDILDAMAELELSRGARLEAAKLYARRAERQEKPREAARTFLKAALLAEGTPREASFLARSLERDPSFAPAHIRRAELTSESDSRAALGDLEAALGAEKSDPDAPSQAERLELERKAGLAALKAGLSESARNHLAFYSAHRPSDVEARRQLASLHRRAGAQEALCDLLGELWPTLEGAERAAAQKEYAELSLDLGRTSAAAEVFRAILSSEPGDLWAAEKLLGLLPAMGGRDEEQEERLRLLSLLAAASSGEARSELLSKRARLYRELGRLGEAKSDLLDAAHASSRPGPLLLELADASKAMGDEAGELSAWTLAVDADPSLAQPAAARILTLAHSRLSSGDPSSARLGFEAAARLPLPPADRCEAHFGLAEAALSKSDRRAAAAALLEASRQGPAKRRVEALLRRGTMLEQLAEHSDAVGAYEAALAIAPGHPEATVGLKRALTQVEDWEGLAEVLATEAAHSQKPQAAQLFAELGTLYLERLGQRGPAEAALRRAVQLDRSDAQVRLRLAALLGEKGEHRAAAELLEEAAESSTPELAAQALRTAASGARASGDSELALRLSRKAHERKPAEGEHLSELADLLYLHGAVAEALPLQAKVAESSSFEDSPERAEEAHLRLSDLAEQAGQGELAESSLRKLLERRPLCTAAVERLAALLSEHRPREAIQLLAEHALSLAPCERTSRSLQKLAERAKAELADVELSARLYGRAAEMSAQPLELRRARAALFREAGRTQELMAELAELADILLREGELEQALTSYEEEAQLAEQTGRVDEALRTLQAMVDICLDEGQPERAADCQRRRAELMRDAKLDLAGAEAALESAFELRPDLTTAQLAISLAKRRDDREGEIDWLERAIELAQQSPDKAASFVQLAKLHLGIRPDLKVEGSHSLVDAAMSAPDQAEAALRESLRLEPGQKEAESLLIALFERQGRPAEVAAYFEEAALLATEPTAKARLLLRAAEAYKDKAGKPHAAAAALLAARAANPDDVALTAKAADMLHEVGLSQDAAEFDALLLEADPFHSAFERHLSYLSEHQDHQAVAALHLKRAQRQPGEGASRSYLLAAAAFRKAEAEERALLCESQAFEASPASEEAFEAMRRRAGRDVRRLSALLSERARALPEQARELLRERAEALWTAGESLLAAEALDDLLATAPEDERALAERAELAAQAGGPTAAQPYDRKLLQVASERMPLSQKVKTQLRLGHAALNSGAFRDAADSFQAVVGLDEKGEKGREALFLLSEVHARTHNAKGLYETSLLLAKDARPDEAEALYRRAASLFEEPSQALEALLPLARMRPADPDLVDRAAQGLAALGRQGELLELLERSAEVVGGRLAAERLLRAAQVAEGELSDAPRAAELRHRAARVDPENAAALEEVAEEQRRAKDRAGLSATLARLASVLTEPDEASLLWLELGQLLASEGDDAGATAALSRVRERGLKGAGYGEALEALESVFARSGQEAALSKVLADRAELVEGEERSVLLLAAAHASERAGDFLGASALARAALSTRASVEGLMLLASLSRRLGEPARAGAALVQAAALSPAEAAGPLLVESADAWESAGEPAEAKELIERVVREHPGLLKPSDAAARFERLGAPALAAEHGFAAAMAAGQFDRALQLADAARDRPKAQEALWALSLRDGGGPMALRLASELREARDFDSLYRLAEQCERSGASGHAWGLFEELFIEAPPERARQALSKLDQGGQLPRAVEAALSPAIQEKASRLELLLEVSESLLPASREQLWEKAAEALPRHRKALLHAVFDLRLAEGRREQAASLLERMAAEEEDGASRAAVRVELGDLELYLGRADRAAEAFEAALADGGGNASLLKKLLSLYQPSERPDRIIALAERLEGLEGAEAVRPFREAQVEALLSLGRKEHALRLLSELPETKERLAQRAELAGELGMVGVALALRERLASEPDELEQVGLGYLEAGLTVPAARIASRLSAEGKLAARRLFAERLAPTPEGAALAVRLWRELLKEGPADADGWTLLSEALAELRREAEARLADGFGAALTQSTAAAPMEPLRPLQRPNGEDYREAPLGLLPLDERTMPRLWGTLSGVLFTLGAQEVRAALHPQGGAEAYLAEANLLVVGAGALERFGPPEMSFLCALALALGDRGAALARAGPVEGMVEASVMAFGSFPSSLAACRVLALLADEARGVDPASVSPKEVLEKSPAFRAVALSALEMVGG